jgi:DNA-directed RNA polymerase subunit RPC12/RpoP
VGEFEMRFIRLFKRKIPCSFCGKNTPIESSRHLTLITNTEIKEGIACPKCMPRKSGHAIAVKS